ncbi:MAG TPA: mechanosensitive ion channel family protein [Bacteroidales bacterium]|nr:mechanosensitive ion channel family protein [Bacteroidales bacterium]
MLFLKDPAVWLKDFFIGAGLTYGVSAFLSTLSLIILITLLSWIANIVAKTIIRTIVLRVVRRSKSQWDDIFYEQKVFTRLSHFAPALVIWFTSRWALRSSVFWLSMVHYLNYIYMLSIGMVVVLSFIEAWNKIYETLPISKDRSIKGYIQLVKIMVAVFFLLLMISVVFKTDISKIITGLGAIAAILIIVFKDTLLGLVGSIQLSVNKMLKVGDWITMPARDVDGVVTDMSLNTVKVQNFDKTIITIPTYALVSESFQNWTGMEVSGVRQIKGPLFIDMRSIRFIDDRLKEKLSGYPALIDYIEMHQARKENAGQEKPFFDTSRITNLGLFRFYAEEYLRSHPMIDNKNTIMLRHRTPTGNGLPVQVYAYSANNEFVKYEHLQSEIFEHFYAILNEFGLRVYQQPTGDDILELTERRI